jgi:DNA-binding MarR family transcriptional regulator
MSKLVAELEYEGLVEKSADPKDGRGLVIAATAQGKKVMLQGRDRRLALLKERLGRLNAREIARIAAAAPILLKIAARIDSIADPL